MVVALITCKVSLEELGVNGTHVHARPCLPASRKQDNPSCTDIHVEIP